MKLKRTNEINKINTNLDRCRQRTNEDFEDPRSNQFGMDNGISLLSQVQFRCFQDMEILLAWNLAKHKLLYSRRKINLLDNQTRTRSNLPLLDWISRIDKICLKKIGKFYAMINFQLGYIVPVATFRMNEIALSGASEFGLSVLSNHSDMSFCIYYANNSKLGWFDFSRIFKFCLLKKNDLILYSKLNI